MRAVIRTVSDRVEAHRRTAAADAEARARAREDARVALSDVLAALNRLPYAYRVAVVRAVFSFYGWRVPWGMG